jgi:hypothetical protein
MSIFMLGGGGDYSACALDYNVGAMSRSFSKLWVVHEACRALGYYRV